MPSLPIEISQGADYLAERLKLQPSGIQLIFVAHGFLRDHREARRASSVDSRIKILQSV